MRNEAESSTRRRLCNDSERNAGKNCLLPA